MNTIPERRALAKQLGIGHFTLTDFHKVGVVPEPGSPLHTLMGVYDRADMSNSLRAELLDAAAKIDQLTPLARCRMT